MTPDAILSVQGLRKHFKLPAKGLLSRERPVVRAVDGISFDVIPGETLGIVGESGCGKSTTARLIIDLIARDEGAILFKGQAMGEQLSPKEYRRHVQMVFQDSFASLNPRMIVRDIIAFGPQVHGVSQAEGRSSPTRCSPRSASIRRASPGAIRTSSPAASGSASTSRGRSPSGRAC